MSPATKPQWGTPASRLPRHPPTRTSLPSETATRTSLPTRVRRARLRKTPSTSTTRRPGMGTFSRSGFTAPRRAATTNSGAKQRAALLGALARPHPQASTCRSPRPLSSPTRLHRRTPTLPRATSDTRKRPRSPGAPPRPRLNRRQRANHHRPPKANLPAKRTKSARRATRPTRSSARNTNALGALPLRKAQSSNVQTKPTATLEASPAHALTTAASARPYRNKPAEPAFKRWGFALLAPRFARQAGSRDFAVFGRWIEPRFTNVVMPVGVVHTHPARLLNGVQEATAELRRCGAVAAHVDQVRSFAGCNPPHGFTGGVEVSPRKSASRQGKG